MNDATVKARREQLYRLLPALYQALDEQGVPGGEQGPLRELLSVVGEQVNLLEDDLARWYDNWFIETCEDWVVPYLGDLVGYESAVRELDTQDDPESPLNRAVVFPRREVADTLAARRRKGTLALLEELSRRVAGWPARAVEFREITAGTASLNHLNQRRSSAVDVRDGDTLARLDTAFDELPRTVDFRRINSRRTRGRHNLPAIGLHVYRRQTDSSTMAPWFNLREKADERFWGTFNAQDVELPLHVRTTPEERAETIAQVENLPVELTRRMLRGNGSTTHRAAGLGVSAKYYGVDKSLFVAAEWQGSEPRLIPARQVVALDLSVEREPGRADVLRNRILASAEIIRQSDQVEGPEKVNVCELVWVDPESGILAFHPKNTPKAAWSLHYYAKAAPIGGGEYDRYLESLDPIQIVTGGRAALAKELEEQQTLDRKVVEIGDNEFYSREWKCEVPENKTLVIRAANRHQPTIMDTNRNNVDFKFVGQPGSRVVLDGLMFAKGDVRFEGQFESVEIRHCTFIPRGCSLTFAASVTNVSIRHSFTGDIEIVSTPECRDPSRDEPLRLDIADSIVDQEVSPSPPTFFASLTAVRSTVFGTMGVHAVQQIENCIFRDCLTVENRLTGCVRFSYIAPGSRTPPQFHCQPSLPELEAIPVRPRFMSRTYGDPDYARLSDACAAEIHQGADDEGEMGGYHNEFYTQRANHLRQRLQEFVPAGCNAEIIFEN